MKNRLITAVISLGMAASAFAGPDDAVANLPEPSTLGLFVAAAIAITVLAKLKK